MQEEIITPEEAGVVAEEVVAVNVDTTVEEVAEIVGSVGEEVVPETVEETPSEE